VNTGSNASSIESKHLQLQFRTNAGSGIQDERWQWNPAGDHKQRNPAGDHRQLNPE